jgi:hypothetical protein
MTILVQPPPRVDLVEITQDANGVLRGRITRPWSLYLDNLFSRVGGTTGSSNDELMGAPVSIESSSPSVEAETFAPYSEFTALREEVAALSESLSGHDIDQVASIREEAAGQMKIKRVIRDVITLFGVASDTYTISPALADMNKAELRYLGVSSGTPADFSITGVRIDLTNTTTITATRNSAAAAFAIVSFELTEYE